MRMEINHTSNPPLGRAMTWWRPMGNRMDQRLRSIWTPALDNTMLWLGLVCLAHRTVAAEGGDPVQLRLGYFPNLTHAQALYARATGEFERATGVRIVWTAFNAGPSAIESLFTDAVDATFVGPGPTINGHLKSRGEKFVIVAGAASGGAGLVVRKDAGIVSVGDFRDKVIATPQLGNTQDVAARNWFANQGHALKERGGSLTLVPLSNPDQLTMFKKRQIHGAWTVEPWMARLEMEGDGILFLDEKMLWPGGRYVTTHLLVNRTYLAVHHDVVKRLLGALINVTEQINSNKAAAAAVLNAQILKETGKALKPEVMKRAMERVEFTWDPICASLKGSAQAAHRVGLTKKVPGLDAIYSLSLLNAVLKERNMPPVESLDPLPQ